MKKAFQLYLLIFLCAVLAGSLKLNFWPDPPPPPSRIHISEKHLEAIGAGLLAHADTNDGHLPLTLWQLSPKVFSPDNLLSYRFLDPLSDRECEWLYFPRPHLESLKKDDILAASPASFPFYRYPWHSPAVRMVLYRDGRVNYQAEEDFQTNIARQLKESP